MKETTKEQADRIVQAVKDYIARAVESITRRQDNADTLIADLTRRVAELEKRRDEQ